MKKYITYEEDKLKSKIAFMESSLRRIKDLVHLMEEQVEGKRGNMRIADYTFLLEPCKDLEESLKSFNVS
jgi:hypothetical protein